MKNKYRLLKILVTLILLVFLLNFSLKRFEEKKIGKVSVHFVKKPNDDYVYFLDEKRIQEFIFSQYSSQKIGEVDVSLLEKKINQFPSVDSANVYINLNGDINVDIIQRVPMFRLSKGEKSFYVDTKQEEFPLSKYYSHDVLLVSGDVKREEYPNIITLVKKINEDDFCRKYFIGLIKQKEFYQLLTQDGHFKVELGELKNIEFKIDGFKAFMQTYLAGQPMEKYSKISLRFDNQIVTTLRQRKQETTQQN